MSDSASTVNRKAADILAVIENMEHALIKECQTDAETGKYPRLELEIAIKPGDSDE